MSVFDYCKHGTFVGDPYGADYMCLWCEMGWPDPSPRELNERVELAYRRLKDELRLCLKVASEFTTRRDWRWDRFRQEFTKYRINEYRQARESLAEAERWAQGPDDKDWTERRHRQWCLDEIEEERRAGA